MNSLARLQTGQGLEHNGDARMLVEALIAGRP